MSGLHDVCFESERRQAAEYTAALRQARDEAGADALIGLAIRELLWPGVKRRTWRAEELRDIVERADRRFSSDQGEPSTSRCGTKFGRVAEYGPHCGWPHWCALPDGHEGVHVCHCRVTSDGGVR